MSLKYINRKDDVYYLQAGKTRTGKPRYWFGKKLTGEPVEAIPGGYEVRESPENGTVTLRKIRPSEIAPPEIEFLSNTIRKEAGLKHFIVDVDGNSLVVYLPGMSEREAERTIEEITGPLSFMSLRGVAEIRGSLIARSGYDKMMRFELVDGNERLFTIQRWCFRGSIDDWIWLGGPAPLPRLVEKYVKHLGQESFYDIM